MSMSLPVNKFGEFEVLFLTTSNLTTNPRCVKEIKLAVSLGYKVNIIAFHIDNWSAPMEDDIVQSIYPAIIYYINAGRKPLFPWIVSTLFQNISSSVLKLFSFKSIRLNAYASSKRSYLLLQKLKKISKIPSLIIAHNPGAFYPAWKYGKKNNLPIGIDIEDYHPGEKMPVIKQRAVKEMMQQLLPQVNYVSYASPLIKEYSLDLIKNQQKYNNHQIIINNVFSKKEFLEPSAISNNEPLEIIWFSQNIDYNRGLEDILKVLDQIPFLFNLTLIGNCRKTFYLKEIQHRSFIKLKMPVSQVVLHTELSKYDIGLAVEDIKTDMNRDICLTNKIWAYFQAGLFIIASNTKAQYDFISKYPEHGVIISFNNKEIVDTIKMISNKLEVVREKKINRFQKAKTQCWENESMALQNEWTEILKVSSGVI